MRSEHTESSIPLSIPLQGKEMSSSFRENETGQNTEFIPATVEGSSHTNSEVKPGEVKTISVDASFRVKATRGSSLKLVPRNITIGSQEPRNYEQELKKVMRELDRRRERLDEDISKEEASEIRERIDYLHWKFDRLMRLRDPEPYRKIDEAYEDAKLISEEVRKLRDEIRRHMSEKPKP